MNYLSKLITDMRNGSYCFSIFLISFLLLESCMFDINHRVKETLIFAGNNRVELEKVLLHYQGDSLKLEAARFLLVHMKERYFYRGEGIDSVQQVLAEASHRQGFMERERRDKWSNFSYEGLPKVYDAQVLTADYLIENIDLAFEAWQQSRWGKYCSFDDFCRYLLPYWSGNEAPDCWRRAYRDRFLPVLDSLYKGTDIVVAIDSLQYYLRHNINFYYNNDFRFPHAGGLFILDYHIGTCREDTDFLTYLLRALGIPVAVDLYVYSPDNFLGHSWNVFRDTTGCFIPIELQRRVTREWVNHRCKGKVYRYFSIPQEQASFLGNNFKDVTTDYYPVNRLEIPGMVDVDEEGAIGVFSMNGWIPVDKYKRCHGSAWVENIEVGIVYQPLVYVSDGWKERGYPFMPQADGAVFSFVPDTTRMEKVRLIRKHPLTDYWEIRMREMDGIRFYGSNDLDCCKADLLAVSVCDSFYSRECRLQFSAGQRYRYLQIYPPKGRRLNIAEMSVYADSNFNEKLDWLVEKCAPAMYDLAEYSIEKAFDGQNLTRYESGIKDAPCVLDLGSSRQIGGIIYVACNDDNFVSPGDCYELFYQNGRSGWASLGVKIAENDYLDYENVPAGALLWLHDRTKGVEEQAFYLKEGKQVFTYRYLK